MSLDLVKIDGAERAQQLISQLEGLAIGKTQMTTTELYTTVRLLKELCHNPEISNSILSEEALNMLLRLNDSKYNDNNLRPEIFKIIANAMLFAPSLRTVDSIFSIMLGELNSITDTTEAAASRVLFFMTAAPRNYDDASLSCLLEYMTQRLRIYSCRAQFDDASLFALTETCKLLFNILLFALDLPALLVDDIPQLLVAISVALPRRFTPPLSSVVTCLFKLPYEETVYIAHDAATKIVSVYIDVLDDALRSSSADDAIAPLLGLILNIYDSTANTDVQQYFKDRLLSTDDDRDLPLGASSRLPSQLLRITTDPLFPNSKELVYQLLFDMSDRDVRKFVHNIGIGYASGYLVSHDIPIPEDIMYENKQSAPSGDVNPVTGQRLDAEDSSPRLDEMTDEEKELEAERLFVLFERLRQNGVISVENPVRTAVESGRFAEVGQ
ncbi:guanine nucleotide exchange factor [Limtongia smithiae]|uniref:guanine nucleotide exchange factor n=1 Tax=Limtongia smithiae TaxID=1125753 RepID=UPI0034CE90B5